jgi:hypothetical protein
MPDARLIRDISLAFGVPRCVVRFQQNHLEFLLAGVCKESVMAQSIGDAVVGVILVIAVLIIVASHYRREHQKARWLHRMDNTRLWDRLRHRH